MIQMTLKNLQPGGQAVIKYIDGTPALVQRLQDLGLTSGTTVKTISVAPLGDPIKLALRGFEMSLRKEDAQHIIIDKFVQKRETQNEALQHQPPDRVRPHVATTGGLTPVRYRIKVPHWWETPIAVKQQFLISLRAADNMSEIGRGLR